VRAASALGASAIVIAESERSVARGGGSPERSERLRTLALEAARQSGRGDLPALAGPLPLPDALASALAAPTGPSLKLCLEPTAERSLGAELATRGSRPLVLLVGPEGGLSDEERGLAGAAGFVLVRLGRLVLRTELAGPAALGAVLACE
jgi:16S rRNA (uracil1498-N3)-methyltransferase